MNLDLSLEQIALIKRALRDARIHCRSEIRSFDSVKTQDFSVEVSELNQRIKDYEKLYDAIDGSIT